MNGAGNEKPAQRSESGSLLQDCDFYLFGSLVCVRGCRTFLQMSSRVECFSCNFGVHRLSRTS